MNEVDTEVREKLERIVHEHRRLREEHRRAAPEGRTRRHLGDRLERLTAQFERVLRRANLDEQAVERWRAHLRYGAPEPRGPRRAARLVFRGRSAAGAELCVLAREDGTLDALVDGASVERFDSADELWATAPGLTFRLGSAAFAETFLVSPRLLRALRESLEGGAPLNESSVAELVGDGVVDPERRVTPRGRRALDLDASAARRTHHRAGSVSVTIRGPLPARTRRALEEMLDRVADIASSPPLHARAVLSQEQDRALALPVVGKAQVELPSGVVRAHVAAASAAEAVGLLEERLRRNVLDHRRRTEAARQERGSAEPGEWRHGDFATVRPTFFNRPVDERRLVVRTSYAAAALTPEDAAQEMRLLDHDFHLFHDAASGEDALAYARRDGVLALKRAGGNGGWVEPFLLDAEPAARLTAEQAIERLNTTQERFLFFIDAGTGRGAVLYRRRDGHYGLVTLHGTAAGGR